MSKKILSALLALCMVTALAVPAMATSNLEMPTTPNVVSSGSTATTNLVGKIVATQLKVTVPTKITFDIDPTIEVKGTIDVTRQLTNKPSNIEIVNESLVPVYVKINNISVTGGANLVNKEADLSGNKTVMFAYKKTGTVSDFNTEADWLMLDISSSNIYALSNDGGKIDVPSSSNNKLTMEMYAQTINGWAAGDSFTITPTIVVSTSAT